ncbi:N-acetyltransferase [Alkalibacterium pelagium]|uniref:N-acetylglutamate synthase, GNAT family n=2 Tax=Alkalibacterium pelagium TaxID=426702 RepID=A0A1H7KHA2_9LACT|nr:GNAT family N-acetyltransferase [Alkalibacterium pelagium]GEN50746.1 N-acetyltransferase [Alkalibacterium pelagium]SEK86152.1 N-acetylglutamate synthase, GNAT family [Alkalibacterium pelagium]
MADSPVIREYKESDQDQVVELILSIQQQEYGVALTAEDQPDLFKVKRVYQTGHGNFWVALYEDKVVGTISLLDIGKGNAALRKMFVAEGFRGATFNTAKLLLDAAKQWASEQEVDAIYLGTTPLFLAAHRFYAKHGFERINQTDLPEGFPVLEVDKLFFKYNF